MAGDRCTPSGDALKRKEWEFGVLLSDLVEARGDVVPVDYVPPSIDILRAVVHVVEIVRVFPYVKDE